MKKLTALLRKLRLRQILTIFLAGVVLFVSTACNSGDPLGARPENPPVQAGGANNPHKNGGEGSEYKMSTDPSVNSNTAKQAGDRASVQIISQQLIAANAPELLYPGSGATNTKFPEITPDSEKTAERIPNVPNAEVLERVGEAFKDASAFVKDKADEAGERPELKSNPALHK